jgi:DNA-binding response OmpR family regulator
MPDLDGIAAMKHVNYAKIAIPILVISAEEETKFRDVCQELGAIRYLKKPLKGAELLSAIEDAVAIRAAPDIRLKSSPEIWFASAGQSSFPAC